MPPRRHFPARRRATVLVIVLITLLFAATALVAFIEKASRDLMVETRDAGMNRLRQDAYSALEVTLAVLDEFRQTDNGLASPTEGWNDPLGFAGWAPPDGATAEVAFEDESGKLSLPHLDATTFLNLLKLWGLEDSEAQRVTDSLFSWMQKDYVPAGTSSPDYDRAALPYGLPLRPLRSYAELAAIDDARDVFYDDQGRPNDLWHRFVAAISLFDFKQTNLNSASGDVLSALGALNPAQEQQISNYLQGTGDRTREGPSYFQSTADAAGLVGAGTLPSGFGTQISALRINVTIRQGRTAFHLSAVVAPPGGATAVHQTAATTSLTNADQTANNASQPAATTTTGTTAGSSSAAGSTGTTAAPKLNYPFTLLEIRENADISAVPPPSTATQE